MTTITNEQVNEALELLEETAKDKKGELQSLISEKYSNLKSTLMEAGSSAAETLSAAQKREVAALIQAKEAVTEKVKETAAVVDDRVHSNPWPFIGASAVVALLVGYILGHKK